MNQLTYDYALKFVGVPYRWNGKNPIDGFDCSGLVQTLLVSAGIHLKTLYSAQGLYVFLTQTNAEKVDQPKPGSVVFYGENTSAIDHVGFMLDDQFMIEAGGGDHTVVDRATASAKNAFVKVRPYDCMPVAAILHPQY